MKGFITNVYDEECDYQTSEQVGYMYKAHGFGCEGPIGPANEEYLWPLTCNATGISYTNLQRTEQTYDAATLKSYAPFTNIVNITSILYGPNQIDFSEGSSAGRAWFAANFDVNYMLSYITLINWVGAWDDLLGNHMIYQRITDGKWMMDVWDTDSYFGFAAPCENNASCSIYLGEQGAPVGIYQTAGGYNVLKNAFIKCYRSELNARFMLLSGSVLSVANVNSILDEAAAAINVTEFDEASGSGAWLSTIYSSMKTWQQERWTYVTSTYSSYNTSETLDICPNKTDASTNFTQSAWIRRPGTPSVVYNTAGSSSSITVTWDAPNQNGASITGYTLQRSSGSSSDYSIVYTGSSQTHTDSSLSKGDQYTYRVMATNSVGDSAYSAPATFTVGTVATTGSVSSGYITGDQSYSSDASIISSFVSLAILCMSIALF